VRASTGLLRVALRVLSARHLKGWSRDSRLGSALGFPPDSERDLRRRWLPDSQQDSPRNYRLTPLRRRPGFPANSHCRYRPQG